MSQKAEAIANYFLGLAERNEKSITPMKIQKLVYFAHGWHWAIKNEPLVDEDIQAWRFGPVIYSLYREFKEFGDQAITRRAINMRVNPENNELEKHEPEIDRKDNLNELLEKIWEVYGEYSAAQLSNMTHEKGSPWDQVVSKCGGSVPMGIDIPDEIIKDYFCKLAAA